MVSSISTPVRSATLNITCLVHSTATGFLDAAEDALITREREANTILPQARKLRSIERANGIPSAPSTSFWERTRGLLNAHARESYHALEHASVTEQFWLTLWSYRSSSSFPTLDLVLSCTRSELDSLPIFLWCSHDTQSLTKQFLIPRLTLLSQHLRERVPTTRVFSVFAPAFITKTFAECWQQETGVEYIARPYYEAALTYLTRDTLSSEATSRRPTRPRDPFVLRKANMGDLKDVAEQCFDFAQDSDFPISYEGACVEASTYIKRGQMFVCDVELASGVHELASIVAATRNTERNATITKVHTAEAHRKRGYAEALVRYVCERLLYEHEPRFGRAPGDIAPYDAVALYIAHDNIAAATVYDRVGFAGLLGKERPNGIEDFLELGFKDAIKGYW